MLAKANREKQWWRKWIRTGLDSFNRQLVRCGQIFVEREKKRNAYDTMYLYKAKPIE